MDGRTAVVVGGTSGIGLATARLLSARGATVHVTGRSASRLDALRGPDPELILHQADGTSRQDMDELFGQIGDVDWLVLALSGGAGAGPLASLDLGVLRGAFDAKFWGISRPFRRHWRTSRRPARSRSSAREVPARPSRRPPGSPPSTGRSRRS